ncbi:MAG: TetR/AcrR family transcriptional regulator [Gaiellaceae bacterium]
MSISYEGTGRRNQKARTRKALIAAARELLAQGVTPTVEETAAAATISRATAYRYFPNHRELIVAAHPEIEAPSLLGSDPPADPEARLDAVVQALARIFLDNEQTYRTMLLLSLEPDPAVRGELVLREGRRLIWIEDALSPLRERLPEPAFARLVHALSVAVGIEALVTLTDITGLSRRRAVEVMRWSARALLRSALAEGATPGS